MAEKQKRDGDEGKDVFETALDVLRDYGPALVIGLAGRRVAHGDYGRSRTMQKLATKGHAGFLGGVTGVAGGLSVSELIRKTQGEDNVFDRVRKGRRKREGSITT